MRKDEQDAYFATPWNKLDSYVFTVVVDSQFACTETPRTKLFHLHTCDSPDALVA